jgi:hypothetical protein
MIEWVKIWHDVKVVVAEFKVISLLLATGTEGNYLCQINRRFGHHS